MYGRKQSHPLMKATPYKPIIIIMFVSSPCVSEQASLCPSSEWDNRKKESHKGNSILHKITSLKPIIWLFADYTIHHTMIGPLYFFLFWTPDLQSEELSKAVRDCLTEIPEWELFMNWDSLKSPGSLSPIHEAGVESKLNCDSPGYVFIQRAGRPVYILVPYVTFFLLSDPDTKVFLARAASFTLPFLVSRAASPMNILVPRALGTFLSPTGAKGVTFSVCHFRQKNYYEDRVGLAIDVCGSSLQSTWVKSQYIKVKIQTKTQVKGQTQTPSYVFNQTGQVN